MKKTLAHAGGELAYTIRRSKRAKRTSITVYPDGDIVVTLTLFALERTAERFVKNQWQWIQKSLNKIYHDKRIFLPKLSKRDVEQQRTQARLLFQKKVHELNKVYQFPVKRVFAKNHKKQWGSCSSVGNLNFNIRLLYLPEALQKLVVVHELCHLQHMNHSKTFWNEVAKTVPNYKKLEQTLKRYVIV